MFIDDVFKTLYSPLRAFESIVKEPDVRAVIFILALILIVSASSQYILASKISVEVRKPEQDDWTEATYLWDSNGEISNSSDSLEGNYSAMSSVAGSTVWMRLTGVETVNCSGDEGFARLCFGIKWLHQNGTFPDSEATLKLFSNDANDYLKLDLSGKLSNSTSDEWHNSTVDVGPEAKGWVSTGPPDWENVTGLEFRLAWSAPANLTLRIDGLHFGKHVLARKAFPLEQWLIGHSTVTALGFFLSWGLYGGLLLLVVRVFGEEVGSWKSLFIVVGYLFSVTVVYFVINLVSTMMLPETRIEEVDQVWGPAWPYTLMIYFGYIGNVWMAALSVIALRSLYSFSWKKAIGLCAVANVANYFLNPFMLM